MTRPIPLPFENLPARAFHASARIRFGDCDPAGIVFFASWFALANAAVEDFFRDALDVDFHALHAARRIGTGFAHAEADFFAPGLMGDQVLLTPLITRIGGASYAFTMHVHRGSAELLRLQLVTATTHLDERRAVPIPADLRAALTSYQERCADAR
ncbi:acyl-CoA thioesterase [Falsiroseomonas tokyonensis]|uniref:Acyl-CoA thioesterase n=1 Tax=Falsiroseomonas tokyonensis TaxID=430521 RepID=A0ABV7BU59_9PROT|nr:thioesterase family protein [Falsiroseomonas tokyonensis]MBU8537696.1 acyl-CoA thioesterase [Falsiroseomonas tokyonensis]